MRRHRSVFFLLSHLGHPFLSHLMIDSLSVLTRNPIPGIFEFGSQTLGECFLGSFVFDKQTCKLGGTLSSTQSWHESNKEFVTSGALEFNWVSVFTIVNFNLCFFVFTSSKMLLVRRKLAKWGKLNLMTTQAHYADTAKIM